VDSAARAAHTRLGQAANLAVVARSCPSGFTHAVIGGSQKCLHAGEYCAHRDARQYRRYGFVCVRVRGVYRLEDS